MKGYHREDLVLLNICWAYKSGLIDKTTLITTIDQAEHSFGLLKKKGEVMIKLNGNKPETDKPKPVKTGRPKKVQDQETLGKIWKWHQDGYSTRKICGKLADYGIIIHRNTIAKMLERIKARAPSDDDEHYLKLIEEDSKIDRMLNNVKTADFDEINESLDDEDED